MKNQILLTTLTIFIVVASAYESEDFESTHARLTRSVQFQNCHRCPRLIGKLSSAIESGISGFAAAAQGVCDLEDDDSKANECTKFVTSIKTYAKYVNEKLFPEFTGEADYSFACQMLTGFCPPKDSKGDAIFGQSCKNCNYGLGFVLNTTQQAVHFLNKNVRTLFCSHLTGDSLTKCLEGHKHLLHLSSKFTSVVGDSENVKKTCTEAFHCNSD